MTQKTSKEKRQEAIRAWRASGRPATKFCKERNINCHTFYGWLKTERKRTDDNFIRVAPISNETPQICGITLKCQGWEISVFPGFDRDCLKSVFETIRDCHVS